MIGEIVTFLTFVSFVILGWRKSHRLSLIIAGLLFLWRLTYSHLIDFGVYNYSKHLFRQKNTSVEKLFLQNVCSYPALFNICSNEILYV
jgi:hypothetical protein